jgi:flagellar basal body-associated protein FliL
MQRSGKQNRSKTDMKKPKKTIILLSIFTILTLISIITVYAVHQTPTEETTTNTLCTYKSTATYAYTAILETPNTIYNNKTTLKPNEVTLYTKITKQINITLTYTLHATLPTETTITYSLTQALKTATLQYEINATKQPPTDQTQIQITIPPANKNTLQTIKSKIESETGASSPTYALEITPTFTINANTTAGPIHQIFTPQLTIDFKHTGEGDIITIDNLHQTESGAITENQTITNYDILNQHYASYILTTISIIGLCYSTYLYKKTKPTTKKTPLDKLITTYKEIIIETTEEPPPKPDVTTIKMATMEDLAKISEALMKPILYVQKTPTPPKKETTHTFYIIDNNTKYQYKTTASRAL